jgi:hypothetical protein
MIKVFDCDQGSDEWYRVRAGLPTASEFSTVLARGRSGGESKTRRTYMLKLAGEILTGEPMESYSNANMERGKAMEPEARNLYAFLVDDELARVGFIQNGAKGCSPDAFVGPSGMLEIKTAFPHILIDYHTRNDFPPEHVAQCQGALWVAEREWIDLAVYWPKLPLFVRRVYRDEAYITALAVAVNDFNMELCQIVDYMRRHGAARAA